MPDGFSFAAKVPKDITHQRRLVDCREPIAAFAAQTAGLADRRGPTLVQLPPSLVFNADIAARFFDDLRRASEDTAVICEPRHASWFTSEADALLTKRHVARVAADPARIPEAAVPGGWPGLRYARLHGSPRIYYSSYDDAAIARLATDAAASRTDHWTIFDNTASGAAVENALAMLDLSR